ncbi:ROK family glucokinase [Alicyclobacillus cycloheptanicus]|uniref:Glucokinase n=1 Tax=Alicyclobacillus cycloheptanicus TaxID=1457 RepID=A0ABT9XM33_9BACL|nr:ROK family glucokinase [Alicyclobacillus cycloheptanicus]MDQ0191362.1 glucokinase [Alicyclobacillus cycloheptanicus]WDL99843.1 ROK family glucokinase [Alicyclobacillus cycloheptanicus]
MTVWFGVDIGGTKIKTALVSDDGAVLHRHAFDTMASLGPSHACEQLARALHECATAAGISADTIEAVGVGIAGFVEGSTGVVVEAPNLAWRDVPLKSMLEQTLQRPVSIDNDANVAALGEAWQGAARGAKTVLCVTVGTGVGAGIVIGGQVHAGATGMAGEIGHIVVDRDRSLPCGCGKFGCLETRASATAIVRDAKLQQEAGALPASADIRGADDVFSLAREGFEAAKRVIADEADWLGYGLALCAMVLNPDAVVIGGGVSKSGALWLERVQDAFSRYAQPRTIAGVRMALAELGNDAGVVGAARLAALNVTHNR